MKIFNKLHGFRELWKYENRWDLIGRRLFARESLLYYRYQGQEFLVDTRYGDQNGVRDCLFDGMYSSFIGQMQLPHQISVADIGANVGSFTLMLLKHYAIKQLVAVEFNPLTYSRCLFNIYRNWKEGAFPTILNVALAGESGCVEMNPQQGDTGQGIADSKGQTVIQKTTLDDIIARFGGTEVDLCKIDVEGAEYEVFHTGELFCYSTLQEYTDRNSSY